MALTNKLTNIANAIREKTGNSDLLTLDEMASAISSIESGGSGDVTLGGNIIEFGQFTPTTPGSTSVEHYTKETNTNLKCVMIWLNDTSVISEKYSATTIMTYSGKFSGITGSIVGYVSNGSYYAQVKTVFGVQINFNLSNRVTFTVESHANWQVQPETYNYMIVYS